MKSLSLLTVLLLSTLTGRSLVAQTPAAAAMIAAIEGPQETPGLDGLGDRTLADLMGDLGVPGVSVAVIHDFQIHWAKGYGIADVETGLPVDTSSGSSPQVITSGTIRANGATDSWPRSLVSSQENPSGMPSRRGGSMV